MFDVRDFTKFLFINFYFFRSPFVLAEIKVKELNEKNNELETNEDENVKDNHWFFLKKYFFIQLCSTPKKYNKYFILLPMLRIRSFGFEKILKILPVEYHKLNRHAMYSEL